MARYLAPLTFAITLILLLTTLSIPSSSLANPGMLEPGLRIVPNEKVCMVTNMYFGKTQIPVKHKGKTYYGCCENCKKTLADDVKARTAVDPVSGKNVDKATAVIAAVEDGSVIYFESQKTFEEYSKRKVR